MKASTVNSNENYKIVDQYPHSVRPPSKVDTESRNARDETNLLASGHKKLSKSTSNIQKVARKI